MSDSFPDPDDTDDVRTTRLFNEICMVRGWGRIGAHASVVVLGAVAVRPLSTRAELDQWLQAGPGDGPGLAGSAWDELHVYTDEELAEQREEWGPLGGDDEPELSAAEVMALEAAQLQERIATMDRYAAALDTAPVRSCGDLLDFLTACRVLTLDDHGRYALNPAAPLPEEVLPLSPERARAEDETRWHHLHEGTAQRIIALFDPDGLQLSVLRTSLERLGRRLEVDTDDAREGVARLLADGDFHSDADVARIAPHQVFELSVDMDEFHRTRIGIVHGSRDERDDRQS